MPYCKKLNLSIRLNKNSSVELEIKEIKHIFMLINLFLECQPFFSRMKFKFALILGYIIALSDETF